jgi:hypothetical protein
MYILHVNNLGRWDIRGHLSWYTGGINGISCAILCFQNKYDPNKLLCMDAQYTHGTDIYSLRVCPFDDGRDLIAIGGNHGADILLIVCTLCFSKCRSNFRHRTV